MSEGPRKRVAGDQLTRDDDGEDRADSDFVQTPQIADDAEMATRRVLRVRRPEQQAQPATNAFASAGFAFKDASTSGSAAPAVKPSFGFAAPNAGGGGSAAPPAFSFAAPTSSSTADAKAPPAFGFATAAKPSTPSAPSGFSFGNAASNASTSPASTTTPTSFSFGTTAKPTTTGGFSFGSTTAAAAPSSASGATGNGTSGSSGGGFSFGFTPAAKAAESAPAKKDDSAPASSGAPTPLFGAGTFNFNMAVNSFVEARKKMEEEKHDKKSASENDEDDADAPKDDADGTGFGSEVVAQTARDVLANGPSKLFLFEKGEAGAAGRWVERGAGEARLIAEEAKGEAGTHVHRLLVRSGYSLNATVRKNLFTLSKKEAKHLILAVATAEGPHTYLLKFTGPNAEANTTKFSDEIKRIMDGAEKSS